MAVTLPNLFSSIRLMPASGMATRRDRSGLLLTRRVVEPSWRGRLATGNLTRAEHQDLVALITDVVDRNDRVDFIHPRYVLPRAYLTGTWPLMADPTLVSVTHGRQIVVSGLTIGLTLKRGDRLTIMQGTLRCYRFLASDVVVSSTTVQALPLSPRIPLGVFTGGAAVRFANPMVRLAIVPDSYDPEEMHRAGSFSMDVEEALA